MKKVNKRVLENLMKKIRCSKDFKCYKSGLKELCEAKDIGVNLVLVCKDDDAKNCNFSVGFASHYFCKCPIRFYLAQEMSK